MIILNYGDNLLQDKVYALNLKYYFLNLNKCLTNCYFFYAKFYRKSGKKISRSS